ncbi:MAG: MarR family winged helix-turn-helix transcriptional regulator [Sulfitobacter sp.]
MTDFSDVQQCLAFQARRLSRLLTKRYDAALRPCGLRVTQFTLLHILYSHDGIGVNEMAEHTDTDPTTLTRNLAILERNGWLDVGKDEGDLRKRALHLTQSGKDIYHRAMPLWVQVQKEVSGLFDVDLSHALSKLT